MLITVKRYLIDDAHKSQKENDIENREDRHRKKLQLHKENKA